MATRSYVQKDGTIWEWEETSEVSKALESYHSQFSGNYPGPLYAPHPNIKDDRKETN
jgi:hypothetical protein